MTEAMPDRRRTRINAPHGSHRAPRDCPVCGSRLLLTRLGCPECDSELAGAFEPCEFCALGADDRQVLRLFLASRGNVKEVERQLGVSYPAARARVDELLTTLGLLPPEEQAAARQRSERLATLERLARGEIDVDEAEGRL